MKYTATLLALLVFMCCVGLSRAQNPRKQERSQPDEDRLIITTSLVQVDAVVTDKSGRQITDLRPDDFEIVEGCRARDIVGFSYVGLSSKSPESAAKNKSAPPSRIESTPPQIHALRPEQVRRAIAIVVDDFGLSFESIARLRDALEKFISEQTDTSDVIAVVRSSGGPGAMQQFTSNKTQLSIIVGGTFRLGNALPPGDFFLQVIVTDKLAPRDAQSSSQWIDFEIVK